MQIDIQRYDDFAARGIIQQGSWGDGHERACLMSAIVFGAKSTEDCAAQGWPMWLAEMAVWLFDRYPEDKAVTRGRTLALAINNADTRGVDWDRVFRDVRLSAILPIAMRSIGESDEPWRVSCRQAVQWSIDNDGAANPKAAMAARAAMAAEAAWAAWAAWAAGAAWAAEASRAAWAAEASEAAWAAGAAEAAARDEIESALLKILEGKPAE